MLDNWEDKMTIFFTIPLIPTAQMRARHRAIKTKAGHTIATTYTPAKQRREADQLMQLIAQYAPEIPMTGAVEFSMTAYFAVPKSWPAWKRDAALAGDILHTKKPDIDNLQKHIKDCMTKTGYWNDDCQVSDCKDLKKRYAIKPGWEITITEIPQPRTRKNLEANNDTL